MAASAPRQSASAPAWPSAYALPDLAVGRNACEANPRQQIYPQGTRETALLLGRKEVSPQLEFYVEGTFGRYRSAQESAYTTVIVNVPSANPYFQAPPGSDATVVEVVRNSQGLFPNRITRGREEELGGTIGADFRLAHGWLASAFAHASRDKNYTMPGGLDPVAAQTLSNNVTAATAFNPYGDASQNNAGVLAAIDDGYYTRNFAINKLAEASLKLDGPLFRIGGGAVKAAVGLDYRYEDVHQIQDYGTFSSHVFVRDTNVSRDIYAAFGELNIPLVGPDNALPLVRSLQVALSGRYDHYSVNGGTTNPKVGVTWKPIDALSLEGSWSKSFVAPNIGALGGSYLIPQIQQNQTAIGLGVVNVLNVGGGNAVLFPEHATNYSVGGKFAPTWSFLRGLRVGLTYFHVDYRNTQYQPQEGLSNPLFADFLRQIVPPGVILRATPADVAALLARYNVQALVQPGIVFNTITTSALVNAGVLRVRGIDFDLSYGIDTGIGHFNAGIAGTRMLLYKFQLLPTVAPVSQLDTDRAPRWNWRSTFDWAFRGFSANVTWNHTASYVNFSVVPNERVNQFNTYDARIAYEFPFLKGIELSLRAQNLLNKRPPYYAAALGYDAAAASPVGRVWQAGARVRY